MGYYIDQEYSEFFMEEKNVRPALLALKEAAAKRCAEGRMHWGWVHMNMVLEANTFEKAMSEARFDPDFDEDGNVVDLTFNGQKLSDEEEILSAIAPYVKDGSYIQMRGEQNEQWRWIFQDGKIKEVYADVVWGM
jgi:hypothetical protein